MTNTELQNKLAELEKDFASKITELKSALAEQSEKKPGRWVPNDDEGFHFVSLDGSAGETRYIGTEADKYRIKSGNCFQTREEAEAHQLIAVPKGDAEQMLWMVDYLRAASVHLTGKDLHPDGTAFHVQYGISREWVESLGGEAEVARRLRIGWPK